MIYVNDNLIVKICFSCRKNDQCIIDYIFIVWHKMTKELIKKIYIVLNIWRVLLAIIIVETLENNIKEKIHREIMYWGKLTRINSNNVYSVLTYLLLLGEQSYRNLLYYRIGVESLIKKNIFKFFFPIMNTLFINVDDLGECLYIQHGFATVITANKIGDYCWINQQVTIGYKDGTGCPIRIGNGVRVACGAKVLGPICVGDNSTIGANAVVTKDVECNKIMGGGSGKSNWRKY